MYHHSLSLHFYSKLKQIWYSSATFGYTDCLLVSKSINSLIYSVGLVTTLEINDLDNTKKRNK